MNIQLTVDAATMEVIHSNKSSKKNLLDAWDFVPRFTFLGYVLWDYVRVDFIPWDFVWIQILKLVNKLTS